MPLEHYAPGALCPRFIRTRQDMHKVPGKRSIERRKASFTCNSLSTQGAFPLSPCQFACRSVTHNALPRSIPRHESPSRESTCLRPLCLLCHPRGLPPPLHNAPAPFTRQLTVTLAPHRLPSSLQVQAYMEDLALWGANTITVTLAPSYYSSTADPPLVELQHRTAALLHAARGIGMRTGLVLVVNEGLATRPSNISYTQPPGDRPRSGNLVCPHKGRGYLLKMWNDIFRRCAWPPRLCPPGVAGQRRTCRQPEIQTYDARAMH